MCEFLILCCPTQRLLRCSLKPRARSAFRQRLHRCESCCVVLIASVESLSVAFRNAVLSEGSQLVALAVASCVVLSHVASSRVALSRRVPCRVVSCRVVSCRFVSFPLHLVPCRVRPFANVVRWQVTDGEAFPSCHYPIQEKILAVTTRRTASTRPCQLWQMLIYGTLQGHSKSRKSRSSRK